MRLSVPREASFESWLAGLTAPADLRAAADYLNDLANRAEARLRIQTAGSFMQRVPPIASFDGTDRLAPSILDKHAPWTDIRVPEIDTPGMVSHEECQSLLLHRSFLSGRGEVVELGPWLGRSTLFIVAGLEADPNLAGRKLHVFDDFVWRSAWIDKSYPYPDCPANHASFMHIFERYTEPVRALLNVERTRFIDYDGNERVPLLTWNGKPIELCYVDCYGRTFAANEAWFSLLSPFFIRDRTLMVLQVRGTHKEIPRMWFNQLKQFVDSKGNRLELVHELRPGMIVHSSTERSLRNDSAIARPRVSLLPALLAFIAIGTRVLAAGESAVTIHFEPIGFNQLTPGVTFGVAVNNKPQTDNALTRQILTTSTTYQNQHILGWGGWYVDDDTIDMKLLDKLVSRMTGPDKIITLCCAVPAHRVNRDDVESRPRTETFDAFAAVAGDIARRYANDVRYLQVWNEMKGLLADVGRTLGHRCLLRALQ